MNELIMVAVGLLPSLLLFLFIWRKDPVPEPFGQLFKGLCYGALICFPVAALELVVSMLLLGADGPTTILGTTVQAFFVAAVPEEAFKLLALWLLVRKSPWFDEHVDGIVYAVSVSLGFAAIENVAYLFDNADDWQMVAVMRALMAVPGHYAFAVLMGYYYSMYYFVERSTRNYMLILLAPVLAHGCYDALLMASQVNPYVGVIGFFAAVWLCIKLHRYCYRKILAQIKRDNDVTANDYQQTMKEWLS